jgi:hypothetical protein
MEREQYFFDIVRVNNVATEAVTVSNAFSSPEKDNIIKVKASDGGQDTASLRVFSFPNLLLYLYGKTRA